jgi:hypothetical protein
MPIDASYGDLGAQPGRLSGIVFSYNYTLKGCRFAGGHFITSFAGDGTSLVERCDLSSGSRTFAIGGGTFANAVFKDIVVKDNTTGLNFEANYPTQYVTVRGGIFQTGGRDIMLAYWGSQLTLVDSTYSESKIYFYNGLSGGGSGLPGAKLTDKRTFIIKVLDKNNIPITGAVVKLTNKNGTQSFSVTTDTNGLITSKDVEIFYYYPKNNTPHFVTADEKTDYNPFTLEISKAGYETYTAKMTITNKIDMTIKLAPNPSINLSTGGLTKKLKDGVCLNL